MMEVEGEEHFSNEKGLKLNCHFKVIRFLKRLGQIFNILLHLFYIKKISFIDITEII